MGLIENLIKKSRNDKKKNNYLTANIMAAKQEYDSVNIKANKVSEIITELSLAKGNKNKNTRLQLEEKILHYLRDIVWVYNQFVIFHDGFVKFYTQCDNFKITKENKINGDNALNYKKALRLRFEQIYRSFKNKGKNIDDINYKNICHQMLTAFDLAPTKKDNNVNIDY